MADHQIIKPRRNWVANRVPLSSDLLDNEICLNPTDRILYVKNPSTGNIVSITLGGSGGGGGGSANIVEATTAAGFPATGADATLYIATDASRVYRWAGSVYVEIGTSGGGSTDSALRDLFTPPAPTSMTAAGGNAQAVLTWTAPSVLSQTPITGYVIESTPAGGSASTVSTGSTGTSYTKTGLTNGTAYTFRVAAVNSLGQGAFSSASSEVTPSADATPATFANKYSQAGVAASAHSVSGTATITASLTGGPDYTDTRLWLTVVRTGTLSYTVTASSESTDGGRLYLTSSAPSQHSSVQGYDIATISGLTNVSAAVSGAGTSTGTVAVTAGQYIVLRYYRDSSDAALSDRITATLSIA
jgi:hypothetical protein